MQLTFQDVKIDQENGVWLCLKVKEQPQAFKFVMNKKDKKTVSEYVNSHMDIADGKHISPEDVYVVWSCKTLQNWKALVSTPLLDGEYYELTFNGDKKELYLDAYIKFGNRAFLVI